MAWLACVSVWFSVTVLRDRPARFVAGAMYLGALTLLALNAINIDAIVVKSGLARVAEGRPVDVTYMTRELSGDGVPTLVRAVLDGGLQGASAAVTSNTLRADSATAPDAECFVATGLLNRWGPGTEKGATAWSFGAWRARRAVAANEAALRARACPVVEVAPAARARL